MPRTVIPEATRRRLSDAQKRLSSILPAGWTLRVTNRTPDGGVFDLSTDDATGTLDVWVRDKIAPRDVPGLPQPDGPTIVATPWLSPRTRELLKESGVGYLDGTGNVDIEMQRPALVIRTEGASRDPVRRPSPSPRLRGPRAWALLRTLAEVAPPYTGAELAEALGMDPGYVSRLLQSLEGELLIERVPRGAVTAVDWEAVLRQMVTTYSVFTSNDTTTWIAPGGPEQLIRDLAGKRASRWAVTGSFASTIIAPVAAPTTAIIYTPDPERLAKAGRLLPATAGANVVLARPYDSIVFQRTRESDRITYVSTAQIAADNLTGNGRMPEEGEALLAWMRRDPSRWQAPSLTAPPDTYR